MILSLVFGFISGIAIGSFGFVGWGNILAIFILGLVVYLYKYFIQKEHARVLFFVSIFILGLALGLVRMHFSNIYEQSNLTEYADKKVSYTGIVVSEPDVREKNTMLTVLVQKVSNSTNKNLEQSEYIILKHQEKIIISTMLYPEFKYGDEISFSAKITEPKNIESETGRVFDYKGYLRVRGVWYTASFVYPKFISENHGSLIKKYLFKIKKAFNDSLNNALSEPESSLMSGLLLGTKQSLGKELLNEFSRTGVSHIVVLSGYNIAIVAESIMAVLVFLPGSLSFLIGCISIILFTILSGGGASALRASIMVLVALFAKKTNRDYKVGRALGFAVVLMLAPNPLLLIFDPSFQLSVLATIGIVFVSPIIAPLIFKIPEKFGLREIVSSTVATQLTVLPFLVYMMGTLSLIALPINVMILGTIPTTMFLGFITGAFGIVSLYLSFIPAFFAYVFLRYQLSIVHLGSSLSFGAISLNAFSFWIVILIYIVISLGLYFLRRRNILNK